MLLAADYEGCLSLWDAEANACTAQYEEHLKRVWSADFSQVGVSSSTKRRTHAGVAMHA